MGALSGPAGGAQLGRFAIPGSHVLRGKPFLPAFCVGKGLFSWNLAAVCARRDNRLSPASAIVADAMRLIDERTRDGSRHFAALPQAATWGAVCDHVLLLPGAEIVNFVAEGSAKAWLDFRFRQHRFLINAHEGLFRLFVCDPLCPDLILYQVGCHLERLLAPDRSREMLPGHRLRNEDQSAAG
jgi:hypothetical protein